MAKKKKKTYSIQSKEKNKDIVIRIDKITGRIPMSTRVGHVIHGKKYDKKGERKKSRQTLKDY
jgi:hypothetical protein